MKNKKGFTLIELLAVIVVLAIIALIATPIVMNTIKKAKQKANERSIENYKRAVEQAFMSARVDSTLEEGYYRGSKTLVNGNSKVVVDYKGTEVSCSIIKYEDNNLKIDKCNIGSTPEESVDEYVLKTEYNAEVGDYVNYDPTNGGTVSATYISTQENNGVTDQTFDISNYKGKWQILGIEGNGKIKLVSSNIIEPTSGGSDSPDGKYKYYQLKGEKGYINGVDELNKIGSLFSKVEYAESGRSINLADLTAISPGMDLSKVEHARNPKIYHNSKEIGSYGYTVSYKYSKDGTKVNYTSKNGSKMTIDADMFYHYDDETKSFIRNSNADKEKTYTLTNNLNEYYPIKIYNVGNGELSGAGYRWFELLYRNAVLIYGNQVYFVAARRDYANPSGYNSYGIFVASGQGFLGETLTKPLKDSNGNVNINESSKSYGIRAVVTLSSDTSLVKTSSLTLNNINYSVFDIAKN